MKALVCTELGPIENLRVEELPAPIVKPGHVVVDVKSCGVNFPDTLIVQGKYQQKPPLPFAPGMEVAGIVNTVGEGVEHLQPGDHVLALPGWGGFAEQVLVNASRVVALSKSIDFNTAAGFMLTYGTSHHALIDRGQLKADETLLVLGAAGGVGLSAIDIAKTIGAKVIAAASSDDKLALCGEYGADELIDYGREDLKERVKELTNGKGVDMVYDPVGGDFAEPALRATGWRGRYLVIGFAAGAIPKIPLNLTLLKGCSIVGVFWGSFTQREPENNHKAMAELLTWLQEGKLKPHVSAAYPLDQSLQALQDLVDRKAKGKIVVTMD